MGDVTQKTEENISGIKTIKAYGKESQAESEFDEVNIATRKIMLKTRKIFSLYFPIFFRQYRTISPFVLDSVSGSVTSIPHFI